MPTHRYDQTIVDDAAIGPTLYERAAAGWELVSANAQFVGSGTYADPGRWFHALYWRRPVEESATSID